MKRVLSLILVVIMVISYVPVSAKPLLDGSVEFLSEAETLIVRTQDLSLSLLALIDAKEKVEGNISGDIDYFMNTLLEYQNDDGGWGYTNGSASNVVDTSYALIALKRALNVYEKGSLMYSKVSHSLDHGIDFLLEAYNGEAWGYVKDTSTEFYPTVLAVWALGENGYIWRNPIIKNAIIYLKNADIGGISNYTALGLRILAYKSVGYPYDYDFMVGLVKEYLFSEKGIPTSERAFLTFVLVSYEDVNFDVAKALILLEDLKEGEEMFYWKDESGLFKSSEIVKASAYATLSFSLVSDKLSSGLENPFKESCGALKEAQNPDGGWSYIRGFPSNEKTTYYALKALRLCYFRDVSIENGLNWMKERLPTLTLMVKEEREIYSPYIYALLTLSEFDMLSEEEKKEHIELIKSIKLSNGKWGNFLGPQPFDTALAVKALMALGVSSDDPDIEEAKSWLLSISSEGWGTYIETKSYSYMLPSEVSVTLEVLEALQNISTKEELQSHLEWLIEQRTDGGWANMKEHYLFGVFQYKEEPTVELTIRATEVLAKFGYDYKQETLEWVMEKEHDGVWGKTVIDLALATMYLSQFKFIPKTNLYDVVRRIRDEKFAVLYIDDREDTAIKVKDSIEKFFEANVSVEKFEEIGDLNYIILTDFSLNLEEYNPYVKLEVKNGTINLENKTYDVSNTVILAPGKTEMGYVLFVFYEKGLDNVVVEIFESGLIKYLKGRALVVSYEDKNSNGVVDLSDLSVEFVR
jgi:hypothetical protein